MASLFLTTGCLGSDEVVEQTPEEFYCHQTEDFRYTQAEIDGRQQWTANLAREFRINERRDLWCADEEMN